MAESDGEYDPDADELLGLEEIVEDEVAEEEDDDDLGHVGGGGGRGARRAQRGAGREKRAWEGRIQDRVGAGLLKEGADGRITGSLVEAEEARKRKSYIPQSRIRTDSRAEEDLVGGNISMKLTDRFDASYFHLKPLETERKVDENEELTKRRRLRQDTQPFQRGIIRHLLLILDLSESMAEKDFRPNRYLCTLTYATQYIREFFEQNPISQISVLGMHDGLCIRISELSGNPNEHIAAIHALRQPRSAKELAKEPRGAPSLQNALEMSRAALYHTPSHGTREVVIVLGALLSLDPGDIHATIKACARDRIRVSIIGMSGRLKICQEIVARTNHGDDSGYTVALDQQHFRELLMATTTPPVIRSDLPGTAGAAAAEAAAANPASLLQMSFPSRFIEPSPTLCACHGTLTRGGYACSRCGAKVCSLPATCPSCRMTLILSTHLARSYHHLFPLRNWVTVSWAQARRKGTVQCKSCLSPFPPWPEDASRGGDGDEDEDVQMGGAVGEATTAGKGEGKKKGEEGAASESSRYECESCGNHFCIDCDLFCHEVVHNCPGCLSQLPE